MTNEPIQAETSDLQQIRGIGPGLARRLGAAGLGDVARLAVASPQDVSAALRGLPVVSAAAIDEWIAAAARLAPPPSAPSPASVPAAANAAPTHRAAPVDNDVPVATDVPVANGQHYATFGLELLLDQANEVRRTRIRHVQSGRRASWAGWEAARVGAFVAEVAGIGRPAAMAAEVEAAEFAPPEAPTAAPAAHQLHDLAIIPDGATGAGRLLRRDRPFDVRFGVTLMEPGSAAPLTATLYARSLEGGERRPLGHCAAPPAPGPEWATAIAVPDAALSPGTYRLELDVADGGPRARPAAHGEALVIVY